MLSLTTAFAVRSHAKVQNVNNCNMIAMNHMRDINSRKRTQMQALRTELQLLLDTGTVPI